MPLIIVEGPVLKDMEKKRTLVRTLTEALVQAYGLPKEAMWVLIKKNSPENTGVAGELIADRIR